MHTTRTHRLNTARRRLYRAVLVAVLATVSVAVAAAPALANTATHGS